MKSILWSCREDYSKIRSVKLETSFYNSKNFREKNNKMFSSSKSYQALTYETKSFHVKSTRPSREDFSKNQNSQNGNKFFITQKDFQRRTNNKVFFLVEKSPGVNVQHQKFAREHAKRFTLTSSIFLLEHSEKHFEHFSKSKLE